jgi:hypothetical protein
MTDCNCQQEIKEMRESIILLKLSIENLTKICSRMDSHINFVEKTYDTLKTPLNYLTNKVSYITGSREKQIELE